MCAGSRPECERDRDTTVGEAAHKGVPRARHGARAPNASLQFGSADTVSLRGPDCPSRLTPSRTPSAQGECQVESSAVLRVGRVSSPTLAEPLVFDMLSWLALSIAELDRYQPETGPLHRLDQASEGDGRPQRAVPTANAYGRPRGSLCLFWEPSATAAPKLLVCIHVAPGKSISSFFTCRSRLGRGSAPLQSTAAVAFISGPNRNRLSPRMSPASARLVMRFSATTFPLHQPRRHQVPTRPGQCRLLESSSRLTLLQNWTWECQFQPSGGPSRSGPDHPLTSFEERRGSRESGSTPSPPH